MRNSAGMSFGLSALSERVRVPSLRRTPHLAGVFFVAMACIYAVSPYLALWSLSSAFRSHDTATLSEHIDWSALSTSLKADAIDALIGPPPAADDLPDFGTSFASDAVSHAIDTRLTPELLMTMASQMMPAPKAALSFSLRQLYDRLSAHFVSPLCFEAGVITTPGRRPTIVHMKFEQWRWKITGLDIPRSV
ncbi:DUF2939 domain-containing protein [Asaia astilbis]